MLEIDMTIINGKFETKLYDKRDDFPFPIVKYPSICSNIHSKTVYNTLTSQFLRFFRVCNKLDPLIFATARLLKLLLAKGCKKYRLLRQLRKLLHKHRVGAKYGITDMQRDFLSHII